MFFFSFEYQFFSLEGGVGAGRWAKADLHVSSVGEGGVCACLLSVMFGCCSVAVVVDGGIGGGGGGGTVAVVAVAAAVAVAVIVVSVCGVCRIVLYFLVFRLIGGLIRLDLDGSNISLFVLSRKWHYVPNGRTRELTAPLLYIVAACLGSSSARSGYA